MRIDLLKQVVNLNNGIYLEEDIRDGYKTNFVLALPVILKNILKRLIWKPICSILKAKLMPVQIILLHKCFLTIKNILSL